MAVWAQFRQLLLGDVGGAPHAAPGQRQPVRGRAQHEHRQPDRRRNRLGEHGDQDDRRDRQPHAEQGDELRPGRLAVMPAGRPGYGGAAPLFHRVGRRDGEQVGQGQARADPGQPHRHAQEPAHRVLGHDGQAETDRRDQRAPRSRRARCSARRSRRAARAGRSGPSPPGRTPVRTSRSRCCGTRRRTRPRRRRWRAGRRNQSGLRTSLKATTTMMTAVMRPVDQREAARGAGRARTGRPRSRAGRTGRTGAPNRAPPTASRYRSSPGRGPAT